MLETERKEWEKEKQERMKEKEENKALLELLRQFKDLILNINEDDNDKKVSKKVKVIAKNIKNNENKKKEEINKNTRRQEVEVEINTINKLGLQSLPNNNNKCDSSKLTLHSTVIDKR